MGIRDWLSLAPKKPATRQAIAPPVVPERATLYAIRETLRADIKALANNPIAQEILVRYYDIAIHVDDQGEPDHDIEHSVSFRDRINELTVGHLNKIKRKRELELSRQVKKQQEKAQRETRQRRYRNSQPKQKHVPRQTA